MLLKYKVMMKNNNSGGNKKPKDRQNIQSILSNLRVIGNLIVGNITQINLQFIFGDNSSTKQDFNTQKLPNIKALLNKGKNWVRVLHNTLAYKGELLDFNIQLEELPNAVKQNPGFDGAVYTPQQTLSENIINAFIEMGEGERSLLILGEPGSGKTTILLKLLAKLINNFGEDFSKPVPVYFNLSSWTRGQENFADWVAKELKERYHVVSPQIVNQLIERQLLLLLDGLDEVKLEDRKDCVRKLNKFIEEHAVTDIVVCSRLQEYEEVLGSDCHLIKKDKKSSCSEELKLKLQIAFYIQPITMEEIDSYLSLLEQPADYLQRVLRRFQTLRNPLLIFLIIKAKIDIHEMPKTGSLNQVLNYLIEKYVELMLARREESIKLTYKKFYGTNKDETTKYWLHWLATKLKEIPSEETRFQGGIFQIEGMQPYWLPSEKDKFAYRIATGLIVGSILGLIAGFYFVYLLESMSQDKLLTIAITNTLRAKLITIGLLPGLISVLIAVLLPTSSNRWISGGVQGIMFILFLFLVFNLFELQLLRVYVPPIYLAGIFGGTCFTLVRTEIQPIEIWQPEWQQIRNFSLIFGVLGIFYMLARRFFIMPEFYKDKPFYVIYDVIAVMIVGAVYGGLRIRKYPEPPEQGEPNQGIKRSATYTVISFTICAIIAILCASIFDQVRNSILIFLGLSVGLLGGLGANQGSGIVCIQHFILRVILWYRGYIPWNYSHFLNYAIERVFLRKSGGAYFFIHGKLMDYFANIEQSSATASRK
jgi:energy-coupling factor transporter ATP-binding protein EcfA2